MANCMPCQDVYLENKNITISCDKTKKTKNIVYQQALTRISMDWLLKRKENLISMFEKDVDVDHQI